MKKQRLSKIKQLVPGHMADSLTKKGIAGFSGKGSEKREKEGLGAMVHAYYPSNSEG